MVLAAEADLHAAEARAAEAGAHVIAAAHVVGAGQGARVVVAGAEATVRVLAAGRAAQACSADTAGRRHSSWILCD